MAALCMQRGGCRATAWLWQVRSLSGEAAASQPRAGGALQHTAPCTVLCPAHLAAGAAGMQL